MSNDEIKNWYKATKSSSFKKGADFKNHEIEPCSMIGLIGQSGAGKSTALIEFISRAPKFTEIHLFSGSGSATSEPLYVMLKERIPELMTYDDVEDIPALETFDKDSEKLLIIDDWLQVNKKGLDKLAKFATCARKSGFTCFFLSQNYTSIPKPISRNLHYIFLFKVPDARSIETIHRNHINDITKEQFKKLHQIVTSEPRAFLNLDLRKNTLKKNFLQNINTN